MDRGCDGTFVAAMASIRPPASRKAGWPGQQQYMPVLPGKRAKTLKQRAPRSRWGPIMAENDAGTLGQRAHRIDQTVAQTLISHQPQMWQQAGWGKVALWH